MLQKFQNFPLEVSQLTRSVEDSSETRGVTQLMFFPKVRKQSFMPTQRTWKVRNV